MTAFEGKDYVGIEAQPFGREPEFYPIVGYASVEGPKDRSDYVYAGVRTDWKYLSFAFAPGYYSGDDLGSNLEFRTSVDLFLLDEMFSVGWVHLSNAGTANVNPGIDELVFSIRFWL